MYKIIYKAAPALFSSIFSPIQIHASVPLFIQVQMGNAYHEHSKVLTSMDTVFTGLRPWMHIAHIIFFTVLTILIVLVLQSWLKSKKLNKKMVHFIRAVYDLQKPLELIKGPLEEIAKDENINEVQKNKLDVAIWSTYTIQRTVWNLIDQEKSDTFFHYILNSSESKRINLKGLIESKMDSYNQQKEALDRFNPDVLPGKESLNDGLFMEKLVSIIKLNIENTDFNIDILSQEIGMSRSSLYHRIKNITNMAPADFIRIYRLERAKELLATHQYTISEVAYKTGFSDAKYFSAVFKKQYLTSPGSYSKQESNT